MSQQQYAAKKLQAIQARIRAAEAEFGRVTDSVTLVGASKKQDPELIHAFANAGLSNVGENYLQEGVEKCTALSELGLIWHFIGHVQSNKTKPIAENFDWVHGVDRLKIAQRLANQNTKPAAIKLLIQVNLDDEGSKSGVSADQAAELANQIAQLSATTTNSGGAEIKGFMAIPKARSEMSEQRATFAKAQALLALTNQRYGLGLTELSMGMSGDLEAAIAEGATMVRIGTDLFGARK